MGQASARAGGRLGKQAVGQAVKAGGEVGWRDGRRGADTSLALAGGAVESVLRDEWDELQAQRATLVTSLEQTNVVIERIEDEKVGNGRPRNKMLGCSSRVETPPASRADPQTAHTRIADRASGRTQTKVDDTPRGATQSQERQLDGVGVTREERRRDVFCCILSSHL